MLVCPECAHSLSSLFRCSGCGIEYQVSEGIPCLVPHEVRLDGYDARLFELLEPLEAQHFWFRTRNNLIFNTVRSYLPNGQVRIIEIGCGSGTVLDRFVAEGITVEGADLFHEALRRCRDRLGVPVWQVDARFLPFVEEFDVIGLFDCLEHVDDESAVLSGVYRSLRPGGLALITVPALASLWSRIDELSHHRRRYTKEMLVRAVEQAGFIALRATYFNTILVLPLWLQRRVFRWCNLWRSDEVNPETELLNALRVPPRLINSLFSRILSIEGRWLKEGHNLFLGSSLLLVARRPIQAV